MRSIEFKVWHTPTARMYPVASIDFAQSIVYVEPTDTAAKSYRHLLNLADCELLQFTGRIDWFGAKIWEGDVLRHDMFLPDEDKDPENGDEDYSAYYYIVFHKGGFVELMCGETDPDDFRVANALTDYGKMHRTRVASRFERPDLMELPDCYALHPDAIPYE